MARTVSLRGGPLDGAAYKLSSGEARLPGCRLDVSYLRTGDGVRLRRTACYVVRAGGASADYATATDRPAP